MQAIEFIVEVTSAEWNSLRTSSSRQKLFIAEELREVINAWLIDQRFTPDHANARIRPVALVLEFDGSPGLLPAAIEVK